METCLICEKSVPYVIYYAEWIEHKRNPAWVSANRDAHIGRWRWGKAAAKCFTVGEGE